VDNLELEIVRTADKLQRLLDRMKGRERPEIFFNAGAMGGDILYSLIMFDQSSPKPFVLERWSDGSIAVTINGLRI